MLGFLIPAEVSRYFMVPLLERRIDDLVPRAQGAFLYYADGAAVSFPFSTAFLVIFSVFFPAKRTGQEIRPQDNRNPVDQAQFIANLQYNREIWKE